MESSPALALQQCQWDSKQGIYELWEAKERSLEAPEGSLEKEPSAR